LITAVGVLGLNLLTGTTGLISLGHSGFLAVGAYAAGIVKVHWIALRNKDSGGKFTIEERNVAADWKSMVGSDAPKSITLSVSCNSQYTGAKAAAELDWIEFRPAAAP
ncbi:MAG: DUF3047 domain-containing protein, partial [Verrucomicrobia bacterium]|nr:DUF3047 domain-containing protein [Verrucomicrobiota bacterium]